MKPTKHARSIRTYSALRISELVLDPIRSRRNTRTVFGVTDDVLPNLFPLDFGSHGGSEETEEPWRRRTVLICPDQIKVQERGWPNFQ
jgi:hypothetical protein